MSRLWDTPEYWARTEVDELLQDYPARSVAELAASFAQSHPAYEGDPQFARDIVVELLKRAGEGVRFWDEPQDLADIYRDVRRLLEDDPKLFTTTSAQAFEREEAEAPTQWWQRW